MQIRALSERVTRIRAEILVLGFFQDVRPVRGLAGEVDWIHNGIFSHLMKREKLKGRCGEAMLLASQAKLPTPKVLLIGLGPSLSYNDFVLQKVLLDIRARLADLKVKRFAMEAMGVESRLMGWRQFFDVFVATFGKSAATEDLDVTLLTPSEEEARAIAEQIRSASSKTDASGPPNEPTEPPARPADLAGGSGRQTGSPDRQAGATKGRRKT
jgi:Cytosol aminopeptidase family, N-terminal domain